MVNTSIPETMGNNFVKISQLAAVSTYSACDFIGVVYHVGALDQIFVRSSGAKLKLRKTGICDESNSSIQVILSVQNTDVIREGKVERLRQVLAQKNLVKSSSYGLALSTTSGTRIKLDPLDIPESEAVMKKHFIREIKVHEILILAKHPGMTFV